uniref:Uncharacterized protein n=1 Tax=Plectus sambesii TaxID=2011161 RepID=A0A914VG18_9BILA
MVFSFEDKIIIREYLLQGLSPTEIWNCRGAWSWVFSSIANICQQIWQRNFDIERKTGSGRPVSGRTDANIAQV